MSIHKILIANRAEIAERIIRTCKNLGIKSVAVYSSADKNMPYVALADESFWIGGNESSESYLNIDNILHACTNSGATAVHPGYGFLSENPEFVTRLQERNIQFIGPSAKTMLQMGDKIKARELMTKNGIPVVPGYHGSDQSSGRLLQEAKKTGFPIMVKASAGGGGRGLRIVETEKELAGAIESAASEARNAFKNDSLFLEKYIKNPKHIEVQILADRHGNTIHIFERECSLQRRHQKVIEECPSPSISNKQRQTITTLAIQVAKSVDYEGAGTIEFIYDKSNEAFYFLEMNTRLQVEHPVTEMVTGIDLVAEQIHIAMGRPISFSQESLVIDGHSIEARIYAENPSNDFLPDPGRIHFVKFPEAKGIRTDTGIRSGSTISIFYDPMIAKLIVHSENREKAIVKMQDALDKSVLLGTKTNLDFLKALCKNDDFQSAGYNTNTIKDQFSSFKGNTPVNQDKKAAILAASLIHFSNVKNKVDSNKNDFTSSAFRLW